MPTAYLTVDDAPAADLPEKLAVLEERDVPALFFCEGRRLGDHAGHAEMAVEAGYHLGNHLYSHPYASEVSVETFREEVERTEERIDAVYDRAGVERPARLFRFPYGDEGGEHASALQIILGEFGFVPPDREQFGEGYRERFGDVLDWRWSVDFDDWAVESGEELAANVEAVDDRLADESADLLLFHDGGNDPALFEAFLDLLEDRGATFEDPLALLR